MRIDIHTHVLPPELPDFKKMFGYGGFIQLRSNRGCSGCDMIKDDGQFFRKVEANLFDPLIRKGDMDRLGISRQVLSTVPVMFCYWAKPEDGAHVARLLNDHIAGLCSSHAQQFIGLGSLPLQSVELSLKEIDRALKLGLKGFQIGSNVLGKNLSEAEFHPIWKHLEESGACLFVHPWDMMGQEQMQKYWLPWLVGMPAETTRAICSFIFGGVFEKFPKLRVAFAHGGGSFAWTLGRIQHGFEVRPDLCAVDVSKAPKDFAGHFYVDSLVHEAWVLEALIQNVGDQRICLGSDYPFPLGDENPARILDKVQLSSDQRNKIEFKNALDWLGLSS